MKLPPFKLFALIFILSIFLAGCQSALPFYPEWRTKSMESEWNIKFNDPSEKVKENNGTTYKGTVEMKGQDNYVIEGDYTYTKYDLKDLNPDFVINWHREDRTATTACVIDAKTEYLICMNIDPNVDFQFSAVKVK